MNSIDPLRIVHVLSSFDSGGAEQVALSLARLQRDSGHYVYAINLSPGPVGPHGANFEAAGVATHNIPKRGLAIDVSLAIRIAWFLRRVRADVVHTHNPTALIYGGPAGRLARIAVIHTKHGRNPESAKNAWLRRLVGRTAHIFVAVSETTRKVAIEQRNCPIERLLTISNGIQLDDFGPNPEARSELRRSLGIPELARVIGSVGRLTEVKNQTLLIRAAAPLLGHTVRLILVGDGEVREMLQQIALETGRAEFIYFVGHQKHVGRWLAAFDVFALSSNSEGLPLVIPEAMATGCPILSTAVGGIPEVVAEGETGFLVAPGDVAAFSTKLAEMIQEAERSAEWGKRAREVALERYSANRMLDAYMACYRRAIRSQ